MTLKQLRYFEAVAQHGHFGRAASACAISQPALSVQIRELEETLGAQLFERGPRHVRLTRLGEEMLSRVHTILRAVDDLSDLARTSDGQLSGRLRLGVIPTIAPYLLPTLLRHLARSRPGLDIHVRETITDRLLRELSDGQIDTAIVALPLSDPAFVETELFQENLLLVRPASEAGSETPARDDLLRMRLLLLEEGHCFRDQALAFCNMPSPGGRDGMDGTSLTTLVQMVGAGIGVTLIPEIAVPVEIRSEALSVTRLRAPQPSRTVGMVWRKSSPLAPQLQAIASTVRSAAADVLNNAQSAVPFSETDI